MKKKKMLTVSLAALMAAGVLAGCGSEEQVTTTVENTVTGFNEYSVTTMKKVKSIEDLIDKYFYYEQDDAKREEGFYDGILSGLDDPYSVYYTPEEMKRLAEDDSGEFVGIGASVSKNTETGQVYVVKPLKDSPAEAAGIQPGDVFVEVDGITITKEMELDEVVTYVRGTKDSVAKIKMYREGESDFLNFEITRKLLQNITCEYEMLSNGFGYIEVEEFIDNTAEQFYKAVDDLVAQGAKALIVDMRNNPGGFTVVATNMVDYLLEDTAVPKGQGSDKAGVLLEIKDKNGKIIEKDVCQDGHSVDLPMAVLVNDYTASSSEIFSGAMRDYGKAILVGEKTYGKGIVQQVFSLNDGSGVKLTIASYFLPAGDNIHKVGIEPDVEVELPTELRRKANLLHSEDTQLQKAITELGGDPLPEGE